MQLRVLGKGIVPRTTKKGVLNLDLTVKVGSETATRKLETRDKIQFPPVIFEHVAGAKKITIEVEIKGDMKYQGMVEWAPLNGVKLLELESPDKPEVPFYVHICAILGQMQEWPQWSMGFTGVNFPTRLSLLFGKPEYCFEFIVRIKMENSELEVKIHESKLSESTCFDVKQEWNNMDSLALVVWESRKGKLAYRREFSVKEFLTLMIGDPIMPNESECNGHLKVVKSPVRSRIWRFLELVPRIVKLRAFIVVDGKTIIDAIKSFAQQLSLDRHELEASDVNVVFFGNVIDSEEEIKRELQGYTCDTNPGSFEKKMMGIKKIAKDDFSKVENRFGMLDSLCSPLDMREDECNLYYSLVFVVDLPPSTKVEGSADSPISVFSCNIDTDNSIRPLRKMAEVERDLDAWAQRYSFGDKQHWKMASLLKQSEYQCANGQTRQLYYFSDFNGVRNLVCPFGKREERDILNLLDEIGRRQWQALKDRGLELERQRTACASLIGQNWLKSIQASELEQSVKEYLIVEYNLNFD